MSNCIDCGKELQSTGEYPKCYDCQARERKEYYPCKDLITQLVYKAEKGVPGSYL